MVEEKQTTAEKHDLIRSPNAHHITQTIHQLLQVAPKFVSLVNKKIQ